MTELEARSSGKTRETAVATMVVGAVIAYVALQLTGINPFLAIARKTLHSEVCDDAILEDLSKKATVNANFSISRSEGERGSEAAGSGGDAAAVRDLILALRPITSSGTGSVANPDYRMIWQTGMDPTAISVRRRPDSEELDFEIRGRRFVQGLVYTGGKPEEFFARAARFFKTSSESVE